MALKGRNRPGHSALGRKRLGIIWPWVKGQIVPPVNIPIQPQKLVLTWVVNSPTPKWDPIGFDNHSHLVSYHPIFGARPLTPRRLLIDKGAEKKGQAKHVSHLLTARH